MGRSSRSSGQGALSLLSFQDIITSLSGIMILLVLLLVLDISDGGKDMGTIYNTEDSGFRPLLVECSGTSIRAGFCDSTEPPAIYSTDAAGKDKFKKSIAHLDKEKEYVVFFIKPSATDYAMELITAVRVMEVNVGYDAMVENDYIGNFGKAGGL